jgi:hypothetical protein
MVALLLTIIGFVAAMGIPAFLTAIVESAASEMRPSSVRTKSSRRLSRTGNSPSAAVFLTDQSLRSDRRAA